jgi:hypothetical protein
MVVIDSVTSDSIEPFDVAAVSIDWEVKEGLEDAFRMYWPGHPKNGNVIVNLAQARNLANVTSN